SAPCFCSWAAFWLVLVLHAASANADATINKRARFTENPPGDCFAIACRCGYASGRVFRPTGTARGMSAPRIDSKIVPDDEQFRTRDAHNRALAKKLRADVAEAAMGGPEKHRQRHIDRGKLLPRDRVKRLLDPGSPFLEIGQLTACDMYDSEVPGA